MSLHNSRKRSAPSDSQGAPAPKKVHIQCLDNLDERGMDKSQGRSTHAKTPVKRRHKDPKPSLDQEDAKGKKRPVPVTEIIDTGESDSDGASESVFNDDLEDADEMEVDGKNDAASTKDPNGASAPSFHIM
jgi:hypothetical protein